MPDGGAADAPAETNADASPDASPDLAGDGGDDADASADPPDASPACTPPTAAGLTALAPAARPTYLVLDACNVYWTDQTGGVHGVAKNGGPVTLVAPRGPMPTGANGRASWGIAIRDNHLYWSEYISSASAGYASLLRHGEVTRTSLVGHVSTVLWSGMRPGHAIAVDATHVYAHGSELLRVPLAGGPWSVVATSPGSYGLTLTNTHAYWTTWNLIDEVRRAPLSGGAWETFDKGDGAPPASSSVVVNDGTNVYWGDTTEGAATGKVYAKPLAGGPQRLLHAGPIEPLGIAHDATHLYVSTGNGGTILKIEIATGTTTTFAAAQGWPCGIAVDDTFVYWVNNDGGANGIMRRAK